jgi:hypothetical protein
MHVFFIRQRSDAGVHCAGGYLCKPRGQAHGVLPYEPLRPMRKLPLRCSQMQEHCASHMELELPSYQLTTLDSRHADSLAPRWSKA